jgi:hypothetical protein
MFAIVLSLLALASLAVVTLVLRKKSAMLGVPSSASFPSPVRLFTKQTPTVSYENRRHGTRYGELMGTRAGRLVIKLGPNEFVRRQPHLVTMVVESR